MKSLPAGLRPYRRTPEFTADTMPAGLRQNHTTKPGVWGVIHVTQGALEYRILEPAEERHRLTPGQPGIVEPGVRHEVTPLGPVSFYVEFHAATPAAGDPHP